MNMKLVWKIFLKNKAIEIGSALLAFLVILIGIAFVIAIIIGMYFCFHALPLAWQPFIKDVVGCGIIGFIGCLFLFLTTSAFIKWIKDNWRKAKWEADEIEERNK